MAEPTLESLLYEVKCFDERIDELNSQKGDKLKQVSDKILAGESTGDRVRDFLLLNLDYTGKYEKPFRKIQEQLKGQTGNLVLVVEEEKYLFGHRDHNVISIAPTEHYTTNVTGLSLGVLTGELDFDLNHKEFDQQQVLLPTEKYVRRPGLLFDSDGAWELVEGPIQIPARKFLNYQTLQEVPLSHRGSKPLPPKIIAGTEAVEQYLRTQHRGYGIEAYVSGMDLLGREVSEEIRQWYTQFVLHRKQEIVYTISELSLDPTRHKGAIRIALRNALSMGLHQEEGLHLKLQPKEEKEVNVAEYIRAQCVIYEVEMPKP